ncbi:MAG: preprotein translocase subunit SecG [Pirellulales bacterium]|nr:preprotein translocase subunit SecG [Pirellulales bacterium]
MPPFVSSLLMIVLLLTAIFLIVLVLIQRGKGGGLAGAFGGLGGQSAFGTKAGDLFTKITIGVAAFWIVLCIVAVKLSGYRISGPLDDLGGGAEQRPAATAPADEGKQPAGEAPTDSESPPATKTQ